MIYHINVKNQNKVKSRTMKHYIGIHIILQIKTELSFVFL